METSKTTTKGQTTIPAPTREAAHLELGDLLAFEIEGDHLIVRNIHSPDMHTCSISKPHGMNGLYLRMRRPGVIFDPFEVVVISFPFAGSVVRKRRPALVISSKAFNNKHDQLN